MKLMGLEDRLIIEGSPMPAKDTYHIDYTKVSPYLEKARMESKSYLKEAIDGK